MRTEIMVKNLPVSAPVHQYIQKKIGKLNRYLPTIKDAKVEVYEEKTRSPDHSITVKAILKAEGKVLKCQEKASDVYVAIDKVSEALSRQIEHFKGKMKDKSKNAGNREYVEERPIETPEAMSLPKKVVKLKTFPVKPMTVGEAADQMEAIRHDFFIFVNADSGDLNLLYRRKDSNYGLIQPELA